MKSYLVIIASIVALGLLSGSAAAEPRRIFLNGVDLTGVDLRDQTFEKATVRFDANGDLHISAPGFEVKKQPVARKDTRKGTAPAPSAPVSRSAERAGGRFYVVARPPAGKVPSPYRIAVYLNGRLVDVFEPSRTPLVADVTDRIKVGKNKVRFVARPAEADGARRSYSPEDRVEIVLGQGTLKKGTVMIRVPLLDYARNASETRNFDNTYSFTVK